MKPLGTIISCLICGWGLTTTWAETAVDAAAAVQAIQQASDPSAVVSAYASGFAADRNNIALHNAYVTRMVDLGLPELAYHQAELLTNLDVHNGLAWGVVAYVNARRTDMSAAISAITLAAQCAPDHPFVERTAGEIVAWYDAKGNQASLPDTSRDGIAKIRGLLGNRLPFTDAYNAARKAYAQQTSSGEPVVPAQPVPLADSTPYLYTSPPPAYYPADFYSDWGPGWVSYSPWYWWWPAGFFRGCNFSPVVGVTAFDCFHRHHFSPSSRRGTWHRNAAGAPAFFGAGARPSPAVATSARATFVARSAVKPTAIFTGRSVAAGNVVGGGMTPALRPAGIPTFGATSVNRSAWFGQRMTITTGGNTATYQGRQLVFPSHVAGVSATPHISTPTFGRSWPPVVQTDTSTPAPTYQAPSSAPGRTWTPVIHNHIPTPTPNYPVTYNAPAAPPVSSSRSFQPPISVPRPSGGGGGWHSGGRGGSGGGGDFHGSRR